MNSRTIKLLAAMALIACLLQSAHAERDNDNDDFDDAGYEDSGSPQNHDSDSSEHNPRNYSPANDDDLDDDDDVDESNNVLKVAAEPRSFYSSASSIVLPIPISRQKRSLKITDDDENDIESGVARSASQPLVRNRRHLKKKKHYIGPVYTYVKTDKHAHYKWGVKHKVGKHYG